MVLRMKITIELLTEELLKRGLRPSYQRLKVLEYLYNEAGHPTVDEIFAALLPEIPSLSRTTVYNTLNAFVELGMVRVISMNGIEKRYDVTLRNHGHFQCENCGVIYNFTVDIDSLFIGDLAQFEVREKNVYFNGLCPNCLKSDKSKKE